MMSPYLLSFPMAASRRGQHTPALTATLNAPDSNRISLFQRLPIQGGSLHAKHDAAYELVFSHYTRAALFVNPLAKEIFLCYDACRYIKALPAQEWNGSKSQRYQAAVDGHYAAHCHWVTPRRQRASGRPEPEYFPCAILCL